MKNKVQQNEDNQPVITISVVGDISFEGRLSGNPDASVFSNVREIIYCIDLGIGNLENPLTARGQRVPGKCTLRGDPGWANVLKETGFKLMSLANNHVMDYGPEGLFDTISALESAGIMHVGAGKNRDEAYAPLFVPVRGKNIAVLARSSVIVSSSCYASLSKPGVAFLEKEELTENVKKCKEKAELVIVLLHWGLEEYAYPSPTQINLSRQLVMAGADAVIGHHPHVLQGMERIRKGVVAYSLGNFLFDEFVWKNGTMDNEIRLTISESNRKGMILQLTWDSTNRLNYSTFFTRIDKDIHITIDSEIEREKEFIRLSGAIDRPLYDYWWRFYSIRQEWNLRIKKRVASPNIIKNIKKIQLHHIKNFVHSIRRSANIAMEKSTNPYE